MNQNATRRAAVTALAGGAAFLVQKAHGQVVWQVDAAKCVNSRNSAPDPGTTLKVFAPISLIARETTAGCIAHSARITTSTECATTSRAIRSRSGCCLMFQNRKLMPGMGDFPRHVPMTLYPQST